MKKLTDFKKFTLTLVFAIIGVISWGQGLSLQTSGEPNSSINPYLIKTPDDWNTFATTSSYWASGVYVQLDADIPVSGMVGVWSATESERIPYSGTFDGNWHTLTFNKGDINNPFNEEKCAPFRYISGATIENLTVTGKIVSSKKHMGGFVAWAESASASYITNCTSSIEIDCSKIDNGTGQGITPDNKKQWDCSAGGFIGQIESGNVTFENCVFDGNIHKGTDPNIQANANRGAGFVSYVQNNRAIFTNCTMAGIVDLSSYVSTFGRNGKNTYNGTCYYTRDYGDVPATNCDAALDDPNDFSKKYMVGETAKYVPSAVFTGLETTSFQYEGTPIVLTPTVSYYGKTLTRGTDYVIKINGVELETGNPTFNAGGDYELSIEGKTGSSYAGAHTVTINVFEINSWAALATALSSSSGTFTLTQDITATNPTTTDLALEVTGNITLNMNGHTINRNLSEKVVKGQVIRISSTGNLTINGGSGSGGTIRGGYNWANGSEIDGGGIYNKGTLVLNNVNVTNNICVKATDDPDAAEARGGGIYSGPGSSLTINGGNINSNEARGGGGGIYAYNTNTCNIDGASISYNQSESKGGGLRVNASNKTINLTNCSMWLNLATTTVGEGGGIYMENGTLYLTDCDIMGNQSRYRGCGFFSKNGTTYATRCNISWNGSFSVEDTNLGGGVCLIESSHSVFVMDGGTIEGNNSNANGGGIFISENSVFQIKGDVIIRDNFKASVEKGATSNNAYLGNNAVIEVVGALGSSAEIVISNETPGTYVTFSDPSYADVTKFVMDDEDNRMIIDGDGDLVIYEPFKWNDESNWPSSITKDASGNYTIGMAITIPDGCVATPNSITLQGAGEVIIEEGGQLVYNNSISATIHKDIEKATAEEGGWYTISSAVHDDGQSYESISNVFYLVQDKLNDILTWPYDMYLYDEAASYWRNQKSSTSGYDIMEGGRGYLYRNGENRTLSYHGKTTIGTVNDYTLSCAADNNLKGFNLVGNPYPHNIYKGVAFATTTDTLATGYYVLAGDGSWQTKTNADAIGVNQGFLVQATTASNGKRLQFKDKTAAPSASREEHRNIVFKVENSEYSDIAYALFEECTGLNKISHRNQDVPMLYVNLNNQDYAIATINDNVKSFNLNFEAKTTGHYTLSMNHQGEYDYLHLIDNVAGKDVDLLKDGKYEFVGSSADNADRFVVKLSPSTSSGTDSETFAWQNGNEIIVSGDGELQIFDVMGRLVSTCRVTGVETVEKPSQTGVYIFRLEGKTQKMVVR